MNADPRLLELLDAELDGTLDAAGAAELEQRLASDPAARTARAELQQMHAELSGLPEQPVPPGLRDAILSALPPEATNLSGAGRYVIPWPGRKRRTMRSAPSQSTSIPTSRSHMKRSKILAIGAVAAAIGAVLYFGLNQPSPTGSDAVGTIAPAPRYQAETVDDTDVTLDDEGTAKFMQSDAFRLIQSDAKLAAALSSDAFRQALASDAFRQALASDAFRQALASDSFRQALASDAFRQSLASDSFRQALASDAYRQALASDSFRQSLASDSFRQALASDSFRQSLASDSFRQALASDAFRQALASDAFRQALSSDAFRQSLASDAFRQSLASDAFRQSMASSAAASAAFKAEVASSDAFRQALASDAFRQALASDAFRQALRSDSAAAAH